MLVEHGLTDSNELYKFVGGIFMSISSAKLNVPYLQTVYQADAAHMKFDKYTLYSCYGITPNCKFGNQDKEGWVKFWEFAKRVHPCLKFQLQIETP